MTLRFFCRKKIPGKGRLAGFSRKVCAALPELRVRGETCILFVSDKTIKEISKRYLGSNKTTDVIAFSYPSHVSHFNKEGSLNISLFPKGGGLIFPPFPKGDKGGFFKQGNLPFGDIIISVETADRQSREGGHTLTQELALLILHGLLHLLGHEDNTALKRKRMFSLQRKIFGKLDPEGILTPPDFRCPALPMKIFNKAAPASYEI